MFALCHLDRTSSWPIAGWYAVVGCRCDGQIAVNCRLRNRVAVCMRESSRSQDMSMRKLCIEVPMEAVLFPVFVSDLNPCLLHRVQVGFRLESTVHSGGFTCREDGAPWPWLALFVQP